MRPPGLAEVEAAQADGRWDAAYESQRTATVPPDLSEALAQNPRAANTFEALARTPRYLLILRLMKARTPHTRTDQLAKIVAELSTHPETTPH
jgi:uncharacterized protein YdeI (YjbR/CyaY-like superfamily)